ncbi:MAG: GNAT family N-acetyltransferase [Alphaproteobacteria bacterium]|jgi:CelD/BcsL family acetyltransferase involved in cellulose biosynthesis|nr:GNAT family N-acetyltransferase [Alphaproteobacteria bacterium]MBU1548523.1 GNAT family N-acetyltransferase [Alphaproteobacteria bacterium]MBU2337719.1 GNAT family N-acetyltransferase [Alphaproteobacteria bacterium]MBU2389856.1 GNAT family N-acetyltransferase [Alphaproteobacteria bacterium]
MTTALAESVPVARMTGEMAAAVLPQAARPLSSVSQRDFKVAVTQRIEEVEAVWRKLSQLGSFESPGQSYDFIRLWIAYKNIGLEDQRFVVAHLHGRPIALLPLHRRRVAGIRVFTWFPGSQVGCYAPVCDYAALANLGPQGREALWKAMAGSLRGADVLYLRSVHDSIDGRNTLFKELGSSLAAETLYRSQFSSWEECDKQQRNRSRRKHDRQQGDKLSALGKVRFEQVADPVAGAEAIDVMFRQRSARFRAQGIRDVFVRDKLLGFYRQAMQEGSGVEVRLHVLRLDDEIVAVRYNIVHADRMFCLISSMSENPEIQVGSPGKQCLLRVMQAVFEDGFTIFDMGQGITDEKRHWCNVEVPLRHHYIGLTWRGHAATGLHQVFQRIRRKAKSHLGLKNSLRYLRQWSGLLITGGLF